MRYENGAFMPTPQQRPQSKDLMPHLWKAGLKAFYDESCGWHHTPDSLAAWSETSVESQTRFTALLAGPVLAWLKYCHPAVYLEVESARKGPISVEMALRAMGLPHPEVVVVGNPSFDFGAIPEGGSATLPLTVANKGPRGVAKVAITFVTPQPYCIHSNLRDDDCPLGSGFSRTIEVTAMVPWGHRTVVSNASLELHIDNGRILAVYPIRFRSAVPKSRMVIYAAIGSGILCCIGLGFWAFMAIGAAWRKETQERGPANSVQEIRPAGPAEEVHLPSSPPAASPTLTPTQEVVPPTAASPTGAEITIPSLGYRMALVTGGTFTMGSPASEPGRDPDEAQRPTTLTRDYYLGLTEVTQDQWAKAMGSRPSGFSGNSLPVENISWYDAIAFCNRLSEIEGLGAAYSGSGDHLRWNRDALGYRLPTEAEWDRAARANDNTRFPGSNSVSDVAWYKANAGSTTHPVGRLRPNGWGFYDMSGNVWEWIWDWHPCSSSGSCSQSWVGTATDPSGPEGGSERVYRGGSWKEPIDKVRIANRGYYRPGVATKDKGLRLARNVTGP